MSLATVTADDFEAQIGTTFAFRVDGQPAAGLTLVEVRRLGLAVDGRRQPFSLRFEEDRDAALAQSIYPLTHEAFGDLDIFIVPLAQSGARCTYEAIFT